MDPISQSSIMQSIDRDTLDSMPIWRYEGDIFFMKDQNSAREMIKLLLSYDCLGFDTETRPAFRKGQHYDPSLVQFAADDFVTIFHLPTCGGINCLIPIFEAEHPLKVCVGVADDVRHLQKMQQFSANGFVELTTTTEALGVQDRSLRKLCGIFLGVRISKKEQTSNWAKTPLTDNQLRYAATDAWVSRKIYEVAEHMLSIRP
jgi:ribonuclease D